MTENVTSKLQFKGGNPGAVQYGNFINYYQFHPPHERIMLLTQNIWNKNTNGPFIALDVGCNAGDLTVALQDYLKNNVSTNSRILGIDIDPLLVQRANELYSDKVLFKSLDIMDENNRNQILNQFLADNNASRFSVVFCFSTTMWIHLNYGDTGLESFLKYICSIADMVIIEPQPWKCYKTAVKRMKQKNFTFPAFTMLRYRESIEDDIEYILTKDIGMCKVCESQRTVWERKLLVFKHVNK